MRFAMAMLLVLAPCLTRAQTIPKPPTLVLVPQVIGGQWKVERAPDGSWWRERKVSAPLPALWGAGLALFVASYAIGALAGTFGDNNPLALFPIMGPMAVGMTSQDGNADLWALDHVAQATGFVLFLVGLAASERVEREPIVLPY